MNEYGWIHMEGRSADDKCIFYGSMTSIDVAHDHFVMTSCLELERAVRLRGVPIIPIAVGALVVVGSNVSLWTLIRGWFEARRRSRAAVAKLAGSAS